MGRTTRRRGRPQPSRPHLHRRGSVVLGGLDNVPQGDRIGRWGPMGRDEGYVRRPIERHHLAYYQRNIGATHAGPLHHAED